MTQIKVQYNPNNIKGLAIITPTIHGDARGYFMETYNKNEMKVARLDINFIQDNQSKSSKGVLRGLHYQKQYPQGKLVRVISGLVYDVAVDLRKGSPTFGKYFGILLSDENNLQFYISPGFAHGFLVLSDTAILTYKVTDYWHPNDEGGLAWDDPDVNVAWPLDQLNGTSVLLSEKDKVNPCFKEFMKQSHAILQ